MTEVLKRLLVSRKFWLCVFGVVQSLVFASIPNFNPDVWKAIDALVIMLITTIAYEDGAYLKAGEKG